MTGATGSVGATGSQGLRGEPGKVVAAMMSVGKFYLLCLRDNSIVHLDL